MSDDRMSVGSLADALGLDSRARRPILDPDTAATLLDRIRQAGGMHGLKAKTPLADLILTRATPEVAAHLDRTRASFVVLKASPIRNREAMIRTGRIISLLESELSRAQERDELQSFRPDGCWCLGNGGKRPYFKPIATGRRIVDKNDTELAEVEPVELLSEHCDGCDEGRARAASDAAILARYDEQVRHQLVVKRFGEVGIPVEYQGFAWREIHDTDAVEHIERWRNDPKSERDAHHWLLLYGPGGRGKTTVMNGLAEELAAAGESALMRKMPSLLSDIRSAFGDSGRLDEIRTALKSVRHLFLDDIGSEVTRDWVGEFLFDILDHRHDHHMPTYLSTNLWEDPNVITDGRRGRGLGPFAEHIGTRIWGRVKRMAEPVRMNGVDMRDLPHSGK